MRNQVTANTRHFGTVDTVYSFELVGHQSKLEDLVPVVIRGVLTDHVIAIAPSLESDVLEHGGRGEQILSFVLRDVP